MEFKLYTLILYVQHKQTMCTLFLSLGTPNFKIRVLQNISSSPWTTLKGQKSMALFYYEN